MTQALIAYKKSKLAKAKLPKSVEAVAVMALQKQRAPVLELTRDDRMEAYREDVKQTMVSASITALAAKLAKVDGKVNQKEIDSFTRVFPLPPIGENYNELFLSACEERLEFQYYARRLVGYFPDNELFLEGLFSCLVDFAACDKPININEIIFLQEIVKIFNLDQKVFEQKLRYHIVPNEGPEQVLLLKKNSKLADLKKAYSQAAQHYNPVTLSNMCSIPALIKIANERMEKINNAYKILRKTYKS